ncbi:hypothetical protein N7463_010213 [Penicillium fimorum]|uniref:Uncharacterized protein n=1 Tax=Penicillium fimorum TaxID=1882269 RepID=A0A9X0C174_9EURO|nr:hypothetical protein N7463_010213 [Penicillium fimorum]
MAPALSPLPGPSPWDKDGSHAVNGFSGAYGPSPIPAALDNPNSMIVAARSSIGAAHLLGGDVS